MKLKVFLASILSSGVLLTSGAGSQPRKVLAQTQPDASQSVQATNPAQLTRQPSAPQEKIVAVPEPPQEQMTDHEWKRFVIGQKVIILKTDPKQDGRGFHRYGKSFKSRGEAERITGYVGRTGVVVELMTEKDDLWSWDGYVIALDGSDEKVVARTHHLGFLAEMEVAKTYAGQSLWSGGISLVKDYASTMTEDQIKANSFTVPDGQRLVVSRAEWGEAWSPIILCFQTLQGEEGCLKTGGHITEKFGQRSGFYLRDLYFADPLRESQAERAESAEQMAANLARLKGEWEISATYSGGGLTLSGKQASLTFSTTTVTGKHVIEQPAPDIVTFKLSSNPADYVVTLKFDRASNRYILSARRGDDPVIDDVALVYREKEGFVKPGPSKGGRRGFSPQISVTDTGDHTWLIRPDLKANFTKLKEGEKRNL